MLIRRFLKEELKSERVTEIDELHPRVLLIRDFRDV
jgi:hypothetical protein